jgi:hypothetical protein
MTKTVLSQLGKIIRKSRKKMNPKITNAEQAQISKYALSLIIQRPEKSN